MIFIDFLGQYYNDHNIYELKCETFSTDKKIKLQLVKINTGQIVKSQTFSLDFLFQLDDSIILALKELVEKRK